MGEYVLGSADAELDRLELQAESLRRGTRLLLEAAGVGAGMRVLDLGSGLGHVAVEAASLVGPQGSVVGIDNDPRLVTAARVRNAGVANLTFAEGDVASWRDEAPYDVVVGRLILFHLPDPVAVLRHHLQSVRPGGRLVMVDYDVAGLRAEPRDPLTERLSQLIMQAFRAAGADPTIGARLQALLANAGAVDVDGLAVAEYIANGDPLGPAMFGGILRTLAPVMVGRGLATEDELGLDSLEHRITESLRVQRSVVVPPLLVGAWGRHG